MPKLVAGQRIGTWDPGRTSGYCEAIYVGNGSFSLVACIEVKWDVRFAQIVDAVPHLDYLVYERFALYASHAKDQINSEFPSVQFIGAIQLAAYLSGKLDRIYVQPAHERRNVAVLKQDLPMVKGSQHKIDAYQHCRYFCLLHKLDTK